MPDIKEEKPKPGRDATPRAEARQLPGHRPAVDERDVHRPPGLHRDHHLQPPARGEGDAGVPGGRPGHPDPQFGEPAGAAVQNQQFQNRSWPSSARCSGHRTSSATTTTSSGRSAGSLVVSSAVPGAGGSANRVGWDNSATISQPKCGRCSRPRRLRHSRCYASISTPLTQGFRFLRPRRFSTEHMGGQCSR